ncbi:hypothetical protein NL404_27720, partial [Klebsiella pneumoniae]|nr:hypothetical protein [Klebsiella pneumoniae]
SVLEMGADVAAWTHRNLPGLDLAPRFHPKCTEKPVAGGGLQILSPQASSYVLHRSGGADFLRVPLRVKTAQTAGHWHCYL